ncbi:MAG: tRNA (adenosine(37)-N6)-threonylcarbamoyltransferase complex dimerization subunit type 1 TsaB [Pseudomonadota bacterium]
MKLLAVDTSTVACSVALQIDGDVLQRHEVREREHTRQLVPMIRELLDDGRCSLASLDALVLGIGPGSFIGMRIATSLVQGMAHGAGLRVAAVSSMLAVAEEVFARHDAEQVFVAQDAHMDQVYLGQYCFADVARPVADERLQGLSRLDELKRDCVGARYAAGAGWQRYPALWSDNADGFEACADVLYPSARYLLPAAQRQVLGGCLLAPTDLEPAYLRQDVASPPRQS